MAENTKIEWCDHTVNLWWGCDKVHTGCKNCYAEYFSDKRYKKNLWGKNSFRQRIKSAFSELDKYQKIAEKNNQYFKIFCGSMMDIFEVSMPLVNPLEKIFSETYDLRIELFRRIDDGIYKNLIFLFLTKRPQYINQMILYSWLENIPSNIWFGTSISSQETFNEYVPLLIKNTPKKAKLFLSIEPQTEDVNISSKIEKVKWIIQGGESGFKRRGFDVLWAYKIKKYCKDFNIPYFFKQIDKKIEIPTDLQIREFPNF